MKVRIDTSLCEGHAKCMETAPDVFVVKDDDLSHVLVEEVPSASEDKVRRAASICPRAAITVTD